MGAMFFCAFIVIGGRMAVLAQSEPAEPRASAAGASAAVSSASRRTSSSVTASIRVITSSSGGTRPQICTIRASRSARFDGLSSPIKSPAFICARARSISSGRMSSAARLSSSIVISASPANCSAEVPA